MRRWDWTGFAGKQEIGREKRIVEERRGILNRDATDGKGEDDARGDERDVGQDRTGENSQKGITD